MLVFEIVVPGIRLDYEDFDWTLKIDPLLYGLQRQFLDANVALNLFAQAEQQVAALYTPEARKQGSHRRNEILQEAIQAAMPQIGFNGNVDYMNIVLEADIRFKHERWSAGRPPSAFAQAAQLIYAKAFLFALDGFDKYLGVLSKTEGVPGEIAKIHEQIVEFFPDLRGVRNSAHHMEDRVRALGPGEKPLKLQPSNALVLDNLGGSRYGSTMGDGHFGEVDVSVESLSALQGILNDVHGAFKWVGPKQHLPMEF
ncbi:hypothetical protein ACYZT8_20380 [Pseudomonas sp. LB3P93]